MDSARDYKLIKALSIALGALNDFESGSYDDELFMNFMERWEQIARWNLNDPPELLLSMLSPLEDNGPIMAGESLEQLNRSLGKAKLIIQELLLDDN